ncbi:MAG: hypothetical protein HUU20_18800, partial [Pirellulales bacterium]|nr:hypothetical protein [Pirellulales bacterium]
MTTFAIDAIDVHGHYGEYVQRGPGNVSDSFMTADAAEVARRAQQVRIALTFVSPLAALLPRFQADAVAGNEEAARIVPQTEGLRYYVVVDPRRPETYRQAD